MSELKTKPTDVSVEAYLASVGDPQRRADALAVLEMMKEVTKTEPVMWGPSMVGFGSYHYKYASGHEGDFFRIGFAARKSALVLYGLVYYDLDSHKNNVDLLEKQGPFKRGKGCLYIKSLEKIDLEVLRQMIGNAFTNPKPGA
jgi:hypothetical protein